MSECVAGPLEEKVEKGVLSGFQNLLVYMGTIDKCLISEQENTHLDHRGRVKPQRFRRLTNT